MQFFFEFSAKKFLQPEKYFPLRFKKSLELLNARPKLFLNLLNGDGGARTRVQAYRHLNLYVHSHAI